MNEMRLDPILEQWLGDGPNEGPGHGLQRALAATRKVPQQSRWAYPRAWLPAPVAEFQTPRTVTIVALLALTLALLLALAVVVAGRLNNSMLVLAPSDEVIAFAQGGEIYVARPDGSDRRSLNSKVANAIDPLFSPDGTHLAFLAQTSPGGRTARLFIASVDGSTPSLVEISADLQVVRSDVPNLSWSSNSSRLAFAALAGANSQIFVVNRDGTSLRAITDGSAQSDLPSWSPIAAFGQYTGDWIAYRVTQPDRDLVSLERVHPDGTGLELMTAVIGSGSGLSRVSWSPPDPARPEKVEIAPSYSMNLGSGNETQVVIDLGITHQLPIWVDGVGGLADAPIPWSPDSRFLAFIAAGGNAMLAGDDRTADVYEGELINLGPVVDCWVNWSPDSQFLYGGAPNGCAGIVVFPLHNPAAATRLTNEPGTASWRAVP